MDVATRAFINSAVLIVFTAILTFLAAWFWSQRNVARDKAKVILDEHTRTLSRITDLETKLALVNQAVIPISTAFQAILIKELTHYHTPELDALLQKIGPPNTLTTDEQDRMTFLLDERTRDMGPLISASERDAAAILPAIIRRSVAEANVLESAEALKMKLVTVAAVIGIPAVIGMPTLEAEVHNRRVGDIRSR